ncbi:hypothetical protein FACS1894156_8710 [Bacteroidia bacterium]|nr:hypothetical protein FACS1894156_8710 [Bacteroidia bacterium]
MVPYFISTEQANIYNIKRFKNEKKFFQKIILASTEIYNTKYSNQQEATFNFYELPSNIQQQLIKKGITSAEFIFQNKNGQNNVIANFHIENSWWKIILNNISIRYDSYKQHDECSDNNLDVRLTEICLEDGWFFDIDTDWL